MPCIYMEIHIRIALFSFLLKWMSKIAEADDENDDFLLKNLPLMIDYTVL